MPSVVLNKSAAESAANDLFFISRDLEGVSSELSIGITTIRGARGSEELNINSANLLSAPSDAQSEIYSVANEIKAKIMTVEEYSAENGREAAAKFLSTSNDSVNQNSLPSKNNTNTNNTAKEFNMANFEIMEAARRRRREIEKNAEEAKKASEQSSNGSNVLASQSNTTNQGSSVSNTGGSAGSSGGYSAPAVAASAGAAPASTVAKTVATSKSKNTTSNVKKNTTNTTKTQASKSKSTQTSATPKASVSKNIATATKAATTTKSNSNNQTQTTKTPTTSTILNKIESSIPKSSKIITSGNSAAIDKNQTQSVKQTLSSLKTSNSGQILQKPAQAIKDTITKTLTNVTSSPVGDVIKKGITYNKIPISSTPIQTTTNSSSGSSVIPMTAGLGAATATGVGAKVYIDRRNNTTSEDNDDDQKEDDLVIERLDTTENYEIDYNYGLEQDEL